MSWKKKRIRKTGSLTDLQKKTWQAIIECERIIIDDGKDYSKLQAIHALNSSVKAFISLKEITEFEQRLTALEEKVNQSENEKTY
jgi:hypothetical protein